MESILRGLMLAQSLGSINDNTFRWLVVGIAKKHVDVGHHSLMVSLGRSFSHFLIFCLLRRRAFSPTGSPIAPVIQWAKFAEIIVMSLGLIAIYNGWGLSSLFQPIKDWISYSVQPYVMSQLLNESYFHYFWGLLLSPVVKLEGMLNGNLLAVFMVLFLMGCHSTLYSPARFGTLPEIFPPENISQANGWLWG